MPTQALLVVGVKDLRRQLEIVMNLVNDRSLTNLERKLADGLETFISEVHGHLKDGKVVTLVSASTRRGRKSKA